MLYFSSLLCLGIFMFVGKGLIELGGSLYNYLGFMNIGLGIFSSSILAYFGWSINKNLP